MNLHDREWGRKGATLSDKTARQQYSLTQDETDAGKRESTCGIGVICASACLAADSEFEAAG
jgi:hypothetical protein